MSPRPGKHANLMQTIRSCVEAGQYLDTTHAEERKGQRAVLRTEIEYALKNGRHVPSRDKFEELYEAWNYAIEGSTVDRRKLRVIVSFDATTKLLIITVIDLSKKEPKNGKKN